jgi:hypothetical protein
MKRKFYVLTVMAALLVFGGGALAAKPPGAGNGGGGGEVPDYGDLIILHRDVYGVPYLTADLCHQPIAFLSDTCQESCIVAGEPAIAGGVVYVDPNTCAVVVGCESCTQEVDFGRINEARSPDEVFEAQLEEAAITLATADCISLDPAGRLVASTVLDGDIPEIVSATLDSPLQNLALYKQFMLVGYLGAESAQIELPAAKVLDTAARGLGAASDKTGKVGVDLLAYLNNIMGLTELGVTTVLGEPLCQSNKEEVMGLIQLVQKCYLNYGSYTYDRAQNFGALPDPAYIPEALPMDGWFEYLAVLDSTPTFGIVQGPTLAAVPELMAEPGLTASNIGGFAQAVDDTRAVIDFMHIWPVPDEFATELVCEASGEAAYDVSISDMSGLQVPARMVAGTEGRDFTVTVSNAGPEAASGTVTVTAVDENQGPIPTFPRVYDFADLAAGTARSWTELFSIDLGYATTVTWTATVEAEFDVNPLNNSVTEITQVKLTSGGGGH